MHGEGGRSEEAKQFIDKTPVKHNAGSSKLEKVWRFGYKQVVQRLLETDMDIQGTGYCIKFLHSMEGKRCLIGYNGVREVARLTRGQYIINCIVEQRRLLW